jgi:protein TonB
LSLKRFFFYSIAAHVFIIAVIILLMPALKEKKKGGEFFTNLISPEELLQKSVPLPLPRHQVKPVPRIQGAFPKATRRTPANKDSGRTRQEREVSSAHIPSPLPSPPHSPGQRGEKKESEGTNRKPDISGPSVREKLFDKIIIGDLAKRETEKQEEKEKKDKTISFDTKEYKFLIYNRRLKERIENIWTYPPDAAAKGIYGDLIIRFTIKKNGQLGAVELVRTSGHKTLDDAAIKALKDGAPYWPLPEEWGVEAYTIEGHFIYTIYGYYLR